MIPERWSTTAREIVATGLTVNAWCREQGLVYRTVLSHAFRAGVKLGEVVRMERLVKAEALRASGVTMERAACDVGYNSASAFYRSRKQATSHRMTGLRKALPNPIDLAHSEALKTLADGDLGPIGGFPNCELTSE